MQAARLPLTVIYGLPGSGKTTLVKNLCAQRPMERIVSSEMYGGEAAFGHVHQVVFGNDADYLIIEAGGSCQPESLATSLTGADSGLDQLVRLDTMVAVVDASSLLEDFASWELLSDRGLVVHLGHDRALVEALTEQIEFADVVVINKVDRVSPGRRRNTQALIRALNPEAPIIETEFGRIAAQEVLSANLFDLARAQQRARWVNVLSGVGPNAADPPGISSLLYYSQRPFHPERLMQFIRSEWPGVIRARGLFWLATRMDWVGEMSQAGSSRRHRAAGSWWAAILAGQALDRTVRDNLAGVPWDDRFGDRCQQLAFIGIDMDVAQLRTQLDECLLNDPELAQGPEVWQNYADPFPPWPIAGERTRMH
jgi:G3E family GTPase